MTTVPRSIHVRRESPRLNSVGLGGTLRLAPCSRDDSALSIILFTRNKGRQLSFVVEENSCEERVAAVGMARRRKSGSVAFCESCKLNETVFHPRIVPKRYSFSSSSSSSSSPSSSTALSSPLATSIGRVHVERSLIIHFQWLGEKAGTSGLSLK